MWNVFEIMARKYIEKKKRFLIYTNTRPVAHYSQPMKIPSAPPPEPPPTRASVIFCHCLTFGQNLIHRHISYV